MKNNFVINPDYPLTIVPTLQVFEPEEPKNEFTGLITKEGHKIYHSYPTKPIGFVHFPER